MTDPIALSRSKQIFRFLKAFAERRAPTILRLDEQPWHQRLRSWPTHDCVVVGEVQLSSGPGDPEQAVETSAPLIRLRRPQVTPPPTPPSALESWLEPAWDDPGSDLKVRQATSVEIENGGTVTVRFLDDRSRVAALDRWREKRNAWAIAERPVREALKLFEDLFAVRARLTQESERFELVLGDGRLLWRSESGTIDHPLILQRVDIEFDPNGPELRVVDAERSPELLATALSGGSLGPRDLNDLRTELEDRGYHPLEKPATDAFCKRVVQRLHARGQFHDKSGSAAASTEPQISRDPVLILRQRQSGYAAAFERILEDLETHPDLPTSLTHLTGIERPIELGNEAGLTQSPWGAPAEVFFSKPANAEQVRIAAALDQHHAVLVQGPPGTGKSHTIANLIGHLLAQGKRVLVTSHTTKALKVLRDHVVPELRPLCVAVLDNDLDGRRQMEEAIRGILTRLTDGSEATLEAKASQLVADRTRLLQRVDEGTSQIRVAREAEYTPIAIAGETMMPADAARWVATHQSLDSIPGPVEAGAPLPLSALELRDLYRTNVELTRQDEGELEGGLPQLSDLPTPGAFRELVEELSADAEDPDPTFWDRPPAESEIDALERLATSCASFATELMSHDGWHRNIIGAGYSGGSERQLWERLRERIVSAHVHWDKSRPLLVDHEPECDAAAHNEETIAVVREMLASLEGGSSLGSFTMFLKPQWKRTLAMLRVSSGVPNDADHFRAIEASLVIITTRRLVARHWEQIAGVAGLPRFADIPDPPEPVLHDYANQFPDFLDWWGKKWPELHSTMRAAGFRWDAYRRTASANLGAVQPFVKDGTLLTNSVHRVVSNQVVLAKSARARRRLREFDALLEKGHGPTVEGLRNGVRQEDTESYQCAYDELQRLNSKSIVLARRKALLQKLDSVAPGWTTALSDREGAHGQGEPPPEAESAWKWRQLSQELQRRSEIDEGSLKPQLERLQNDLHDATTSLVDARAWASQIRRTDLPARQALQGWADVQGRIGKGTGKRVPELQAEARKLLVQARDAVPVWIMPLARVAETMDPRRKRFDVVIIDEASQSDVLGLLAWYIGEKVVVVGDHEQVSPMAVGQRVDDAQALIAEHLYGVPNDVLYDGKTSVYDLARRSFAGTIALREHFRCVPDIIEFSNQLSYDGDVRPLRDATRVATPHVAECVATSMIGSLRSGSGKTNEAEARIVVGLLAAAAGHPLYKGQTFGAITLLGDEQGELIHRLALDVLGAVELDKRRFQAGNAAQFQGDERDVMFLSMVDSSPGNTLRMMQDDSMKQRYNVAASRAKDQMWLVHSLNPERDLQQGDLRRRLIEHIRNPQALAERTRRTQARAKSPFEEAVRRDLLLAGYNVEPEVWVGRYRLDMVVCGPGTQVAVECDGDRYFGFEKISEDLWRQAVLERVGWRFIRIRSTRYFCDPKATMADVVARLNALGVRPRAKSERAKESHLPFVRDEIVRRAWEIMRKRGWLVEPETSETGAGSKAQTAK